MINSNRISINMVVMMMWCDDVADPVVWIITSVSFRKHLNLFGFKNVPRILYWGVYSETETQGISIWWNSLHVQDGEYVTKRTLSFIKWRRIGRYHSTVRCLYWNIGKICFVFRLDPCYVHIFKPFLCIIYSKV